MLSHNQSDSVIDNEGEKKRLISLILQAKAGNIHAFEEVYTALYTPLYRYVLSRSKNVQVTEDVCQDTFLRFFEALPRYSPDTHPLAYLFTIAKRLLINLSYKHKPVEVDEEMMMTLPDESSSTFDEAHVRMLADHIVEYIPQLTEDEGDVVRLYFLSELSHREIAEILEKEEAYVRKLKERALKKLRILTAHLYEHHA